MNPSSATVNYHACHIYYLSGDFAWARQAPRRPRPAAESPRSSRFSGLITPTASPRCTQGRPGEAASWLGKAAQADGGASHSFLAQGRGLGSWTAAASAGCALVKQHFWRADRADMSKCFHAQTGITRELVAKLAEAARACWRRRNKASKTSKMLGGAPPHEIVGCAH